MEDRYYNDEVNKIDYRGEYPPTFKIRDEHNETKWLSLNEISAKVLIEKLKKEFNIE